jgi:pyridoxal phosphate enzyme (YggS family)
MQRRITDRLARARDAIGIALAGSGRVGEPVRIMAVTKMQQPEVLDAAIRAGVSIIGENRVTEGGRKIREIGRHRAEFHLIGPLHRKELRQALRDFHSIDAIDRIEIAEELVRRLSSLGRPQPGVLLEINTSGEKSKAGFQPDPELLTGVIGRIAEEGLRIDGFLTVGPLGVPERTVRKAFAELRELRDGLSASLGIPLSELSMGMSDDFHWAVMEGATTVRLGRYLFGERPVIPG